MGKKRGSRLLALCLSIMMLFSLAQGTGVSVRAEESENTIPETQEGTSDSSSDTSNDEPEGFVEAEMEALSENEANGVGGIMPLGASLPSRSPQELKNVIDSIKIVNHVGTEYVPDENGVINLPYGVRNRYEVHFDLSAYNNNLVNGDFFTFTIPAPIPVEDENELGTITFTDPNTGVEIAAGTVTSNGEYNGGSAQITLQNLEEYLKATKGETIENVKGTFYVSFKISQEWTEREITFNTEETINKITHKFTVYRTDSGDQSDRIGETNFEKRLNTTSATPFTSAALGKTITASASWYGRINVRQASYDKIVITDIIDIEEHAPMQFIPELLSLRTGHFGTNYEFEYDDYNAPLVNGVDYTVEYNENYTEFVLTINNPSKFESNGKPAAFWLAYSTTITNDGTTVYNAMQMTADDQVLTEKTTNTKTEAVQETSVKTTSGGSITIDTSYSITIYKRDEAMNSLKGAVFKVITPLGEEITLDATGEDGRTKSRQFTSAEAASGEFTIVEVTAPDGYILDTTPIKVNIGSEGVVRTITNKLAEAHGSIVLEGTKTLTGRTLAADEFSFTVKEGTEEVATGKNDATGKITFSEIKYELEDVGTHTYTVSEVISSDEKLGGVEYDKNSYTVTVEVTNNGDGTLTATPTYPTNGVVFANTYAATGSVELTATKSLTGRTLAADEFTFTVRENGSVVATATNKADGSITFPTINYTLDNVGTHTYTVSEVTPAEDEKLGGVTYSTESYTVTVKVSDNGDGTLKTETTYPATGVVFTNTYETKGSAVLQATKTLTGRTLANEEFSFTVKEGNDTVATGKNAAGGTIVFSAINYTSAGEHTYVIAEEKGNDTTIGYDSATFEVKVSVTDDGKGNLTATPTYPEGGVTFTNTYAATGSVTLEASKSLTGRALEADEFTFTVKEGTEEVATGKNDASGKITFSEISYDLEDVGDHTYVITEEKGTDTSITYDKNSYTVTVKVTDDGSGKLSAVATYPDGGVIFKNTYSAKGETQFDGTKTLTGRTLEAEEFSFTVKEGDKVIGTVKNEADGSIAFPVINYTLDDVGTHTYVITEDAGSVSGVTYDTNSVTITVKVSDNGDGTLKVEVTEPNGGIVFNNTYAATGELELTATKKLEGRALNNEEFSFTVKEAGKTVATGKNDTEGKVTFPTIEYTLDDVGTHTYVITEDSGNLGGITYDTNSVTVTVEVTDNRDGTLKVEVSEPAGGVVFTNKYDAVPVQVYLDATKELTGRELNDGEFTFTIKEGTEVVATGENDANGEVTFTEIEYELSDVGTHTLIITEDSGNRGGVEYSKESYTVTVTVSDNGDGTLSANVSQPTGGIIFHNGYEAAEALVNLGAKKIYTGAALKSGMFEFELKDSNGKVLNTAKNDGDGIVSFATLRFVEAGEYKYTISEVIGNNGNITYDKTVYNVTVTVVDDGEGKLIASVEVENGYLQFRNTYTPPQKPYVPNTGSNGISTPMGIMMILVSGLFTAFLFMRDKKRRRA